MVLGRRVAEHVLMRPPPAATIGRRVERQAVLAALLPLDRPVHHPEAFGRGCTRIEEDHPDASNRDRIAPLVENRTPIRLRPVERRTDPQVGFFPENSIARPRMTKLIIERKLLGLR